MLRAILKYIKKEKNLGLLHHQPPFLSVCQQVLVTCHVDHQCVMGVQVVIK